jgi:hypothetical protein
MTGYLCAALAGLVFLVSGTLKALDARAFFRQVLRYRLLPARWAQVVSIFVVGLECALGAGLAVHVSPLLIPAAAVLLVTFAALTAWGTSTGRIDDCGCYGGLLLLTPAQSIALDGVYLALLVAAWFLGPKTWAPARIWQLAVTAAVFTAATAAALRSMERPLANLALLRENRAWRKKWLPQYDRDVTRGSHFIVFLSSECPHCKRWVPLLNVIEARAELPSVVGVMSVSQDSLDGFRGEHLIRFPIVLMRRSLISLMASAYPTAALVEGGKIRHIWRGEMPEEYLESVRQFIAAVSPPKKPANIFGG